MQRLAIAPKQSESISPELPPKERRVYELYIRGSTPKEIAYEMKWSPANVSYYIKRIYKHFGVGTLRELIAHAVKHRYMTYRNADVIQIRGEIHAD